MKKRKFREETLITIYDNKEGKLQVTDSILIKGLLSLDEEEIFSILSRVCFSPKRYTCKREDTLLTCSDLYDNEFKRFHIPVKDTIRRHYSFYPVTD